MVLIGLVDCPNDNLKMYITKRLIVNGLYFLVIAYNSINLRVIRYSRPRPCNRRPFLHPCRVGFYKLGQPFQL